MSNSFVVIDTKHNTWENLLLRSSSDSLWYIYIYIRIFYYEGDTPHKTWEKNAKHVTEAANNRGRDIEQAVLETRRLSVRKLRWARR